MLDKLTTAADALEMYRTRSPEQAKQAVLEFQALSLEDRLELAYWQIVHQGQALSGLMLEAGQESITIDDLKKADN
jgi:hypothetical protein